MSENRFEIQPYDYIEHFMSEAALLVTMDKNNKPNVMALFYKMIGEMWSLPIITVGVAPSRYSFELLTKNIDEFTVNIPSNRIIKAIEIAGDYSGREVDKFKKAGLYIIPGKRIKVPTIKDCILSYECKVRHIDKSGDLSGHNLFFGEVLAAYASNDIKK
ncbi:MAG: flavin reductase family protein [Promethearchaeota archaeon]|jgi:flavin reductase (DIM6/NTAB) family NADH-FMN oxidoreductase RutF